MQNQIRQEGFYANSDKIGRLVKDTIKNWQDSAINTVLNTYNLKKV